MRIRAPVNFFTVAAETPDVPGKLEVRCFDLQRVFEDNSHKLRLPKNKTFYRRDVYNEFIG